MERTRDRAKPPMKKKHTLKLARSDESLLSSEVYYPLREVCPAQFLMWHSALVSHD